MKPRFKWNCSVPGCCVFVGGTDIYDIYMACCHERPYDPGVLLVAGNVGGGLDYEFTNQHHMDKSLRDWEDDGFDRPGLIAAQTFVHTFFPTPLEVALDKLANGEDL